MKNAPQREGDVYYRATYPDPTMFYPTLQAFVYVGKNLSDEDDGDTWYFQFADSYVRDGSIRESDSRNGRVSLASAKDLDEMLTVDEAVEELRRASDRLIAARR